MKNFEKMEDNIRGKRKLGGGVAEKERLKPRFALIIPVYNTEKYLAECLSSIAAQDYLNFVAYIIDDGSTDTSSRIATRFAAEDPRLKYVWKKNGGVSSARNLALDLVEQDGGFDYIAFIDSDDAISADYFNIILDSNIEDRQDCIFIGVEFFDRIGRKKQTKPFNKNVSILNGAEVFDFAFCMGEFFKSKSPASFFALTNVIFSVRKVKGFRFNEELSVGEDLDFKKRVILTMDHAATNPRIAYLYRLRKGPLSYSMRVRHSDYSLFLEWLSEEDELSVEQRINLEEIVFNGWWNCLRVAYCAGVLSEHYDVFKTALLNMHKVFISDVLSKGKNRKRIFIFNLGGTALSLYFCIVIKNKSEVFNENKEYFE